VRRVESAGASQTRFLVSPSVGGGGEECQEGASAANQRVLAIYKKGTGLVTLLACSPVTLWFLCFVVLLKSLDLFVTGLLPVRNKISDR
jgi:hypothetical protein